MQILALLAMGLLTAPRAAEASLITVWDAFDGTPVASGMFIGGSMASENSWRGIQFVPSATGYLAGFTFGGWQGSGTADWLFTLNGDSAGVPGAILETLPLVDVQPIANGLIGVHNVAASDAILLTSGGPY